jgi:molecular chaperone GrpE
MADPKEEDFLDNLEKAMEDEFEQEMSEITDEEAELDALRAERDALQDKFMRALAEAENARKRSDKDRREAQQYGGSRLARDMLPVYDNMKRALEAATDEQRESAKALIEGIELTMRELRNVFGKHGVTVITPEVGDKFDPQLHEAMFEAPLPGTKSGEIIQVSAEGFMLHDRILRPAQVGVSSNPG